MVSICVPLLLFINEFLISSSKEFILRHRHVYTGKCRLNFDSSRNLSLSLYRLFDISNLDLRFFFISVRCLKDKLFPEIFIPNKLIDLSSGANY